MSKNPRTEEKLLFAFPSKGRLRDQALKMFRDGRLVLHEASERGYQAKIQSFPDVNIVLLPPREIALALAENNMHMGITGRDLLREHYPHIRFQEDALSFGGCRLVIAVPQSWIDVTSLDDLIDAAALFRQKQGWRMRVATKYPHLVRQFFSKRGFLDYRLVESMGATEAALTRRSAEIIVDITSTGLTLKHNHLKTILGGEILSSTALLVSTSQRSWSPEVKSAAQKLQKAIMTAQDIAHAHKNAQDNFFDQT